MPRIFIVTAALAAVALVAPVATAMPDRDGADTTAAPQQDLRSADARDASGQPQSGGDDGKSAPHPPIVGDDIMSHAGMPGFPEYDPPTTIAVVRPERTIVRDVDERLPLILSGTALMLVIAGIGIMLVRGRPASRPGRSI